MGKGERVAVSGDDDKIMEAYTRGAEHGEVGKGAYGSGHGT